MLKNIFSHSRKAVIAAVFLVALVAGTLFFLWRTGQRSRAAPGVPTLNYYVEPTTLQAGQNFDLILKVNPNGANFFAFELYTFFDSSKVEFQNTTTLSQNITSSHILVNSSVDTGNSIITITGTRTGSAFTGNADMEIARVKMKVKAGATGDVTFDWGTNTKVGSNITKELLSGTFTIGGGGPQPTASPGGPDLHLNIPTLAGGIAAFPDDNVNVEVFLKSNNIPVKSIDFSMPYDDSKLTFQNTSDLAANIEIDPSSGFNTQFVIKRVDTVNKKIIFALAAPVVNQAPALVSSNNDILIAVIKFKVRSDAPEGNVELLPDTTSTIYNQQTQNILSCTGGFRFGIGVGIPFDTPIPPLPTYTTAPGQPTDTPFPGQPTNTPFPGQPTDTPFPGQPTSTPRVNPDMALDIKLRLQGIVGRPNRLNTLPIRVSLASAGSAVLKTAVTNFTVDDNGIWSGVVNFTSLPETSDYNIYIKGPMHLQRRLCDTNASEATPGSYSCQNGNIQLFGGTNYLDFTGVYILAGDLPPQDSLANAYDISLVINNIGKTDSAALGAADINLDGIVDSQDYSLVIAALAFRSDDEF